MYSVLKNAIQVPISRKLCVPPRRSATNQVVTHMLALSQIDSCAEMPSRGLILGVYADETNIIDAGELTPHAHRYNTLKTNGRFLDVLRMSGPMPKRGEARILFAVETEKIPYFSAVAVVGLGHESLGYDGFEMVDKRKEAIRRGVAAACKALVDLNTERIEVDPCGHAESAAEGAAMGIWAYQELKAKRNRIRTPHFELHTHKDEVCDVEGWRIGLQKANAQNLCRELQEAPSNHLTPTSFAERVIKVLCKTGVNAEVKVEGWAEAQKMNAFLAVARASCEPPIFLELNYFGSTKDERPIVLIGQGITYNCGGLNLKKKNELKIMRADMTGAAAVVSTCKAISSLRLPVNLRALIPLCENVMGCNAFRPNDIVKCANGKSICIQRCDHDGVLVLADALHYAQNFCPKCIVDVGTTSGAMRQFLDEAACGVFTNSEILWQQIKNASVHTGDRVWRLPLWNYYSKLVTNSSIASDVQNFGDGLGGRPCRAAAFLRQFVPCGQWMHIDATNCMVTDGKTFEYLRPGMAGRPTRTLIEFVAQSICKENQPKLPPEKN